MTMPRARTTAPCLRPRLHLLISAGPTREYLDPVRFISNPSTGRMGYALAEAAARAGHRVTLVSGPVTLAPPPRVKVVKVESAREMHAAIHSVFPQCDAVVMTAAVGDYQAARPRAHKLHKTGATLTLRLVRTPDILASLPRRRRQIVIGFAAETHAMCASAARKLAGKNLDMIVANDVSAADAGFGAAALRAVMIWRDGRRRDLGRCSKRSLAQQLVRETEQLYMVKNPPGARDAAQES